MYLSSINGFQAMAKHILNALNGLSSIPILSLSFIRKSQESGSFNGWSFKSKLIENVLEEILKDPELLKKFRDEINK